MDSLQMRPEEIEAESFRIIEKEAGDHGWSSEEWQVVRRVVHTSADFEYVRTLFFSESFVPRAIEALKLGKPVFTDTNMVLSGISKPRLDRFGCACSCHVADPEVVQTAKESGITRSIAAMRKAVAISPDGIFVIGNAPTALFELIRILKTGAAKPSLVIGLPVGFVGAEESKISLAAIACDNPIPFITSMGRKGGSNVAAAVVNALAIMAEKQELPC